jgi:hypothetical protein
LRISQRFNKTAGLRRARMVVVNTMTEFDVLGFNSIFFQCEFRLAANALA